MCNFTSKRRKIPFHIPQTGKIYKWEYQVLDGICNSGNCYIHCSWTTLESNFTSGKVKMYVSYETLLSFHTSYMPWKTLWACALKKHVQDHLCNIRYNSPKLETVQIHSQKTSPSESHIMGVSTTLKRELQLHVLEQTQCGGTKSPMHIFRFHFLSWSYHVF